MAPPAAEPAKSAAQKTAERLSEENAAMKREAVEQEERLKRLHAKIQKMEQDMAGLLRKRGTLGQGAAASAAVRGARDVETERLEAAIHDRQFHIDAISKQLLIIKHTAHGPRKPLSSIYGADRKDAASPYGTAAAAPARRPQSAGGRKGAGAALVSNASEGEMREILATLKRECNSAAERLREARRKAEASASAKDGAEQRDRVLEGKTPDEIRRALEEMKAKTVMLEATEDHRAVTLKNAKEAVERTEPVVQRLKDEHVEVQRKLVDLNHQKKLVELRKGEHDEISAQIVKLRVEQDELEEENRRLRSVAFSAGEVIVTVSQLGNEQEELAELALHNQNLLKELSTRNVASEKALSELESDAPNSISRLEGRARDDAAKAKLLTREIGNLREKLSTFIGHDGASGKMDQSSVREARLLAQRMGVPMYMRVASGTGDADQKLDDLRREIRRLKVLQASELREIGKLRQMAHTQEHLMRHTTAGGAEGERELARIRRVHNNKVAALQRRISEVENKNERLRQLLAQSRVDKLAQVADSEAFASSKSIKDAESNVVVRHEQLMAGRGVVSVTVDGLVLNSEYGDFGRNQPSTLLLLNFYLHDVQNSSPMRGLAPDGSLRRDFEVSIDSLFLHFLYHESVQIQLVLVRGLEFDTIAQAALPLRDLIQDAAGGRVPRLDKQRVQLVSTERDAATSAGAARKGPVGHVNVVMQVQARFSEQAGEFIAQQQAATSLSTSIQRRPSADSARESSALLEEFPRHIGCTYVLIVKLISISDIAAMSLRRTTSASTDGPRARRRFLAMHQLLDFPVNETDTISVVEGSQASLFAAGAAPYKIPASPEWDRRLLAGRLEMVLLDQSDPSDDVVGTAEVMLAPLISRRGVAATVPLYDAGGQVSAYLKVEVAWEPEPLFDTGRGLSDREVDAIEDRLVVIRTWIKYMGLGELEAATKALYESWERDGRFAGIATEGVSRAQWVAILREMRDGAAKEAAHQGATLQSITEAEMVAIFNYLTGAGGGGAGVEPSKLQKVTLVQAIVGGGAGGGGAERQKAHASAGGSADAKSTPPSAPPAQRVESGQSAAAGGVSGAGQVGDVADVGGQSLRLRVEAVKCLDLLKHSASHCKELAIKARCLGGKLAGKTSTHTSQQFDNSAVAGGFVAFHAEWGLQASERDQIMQALTDDASVAEELCLELELCRVSGPGVDGAALPQPDTDLVVGIWRLPLKDLSVGGDLKAHSATIQAAVPLGDIKKGDVIAELRLDVTGSSLVSSLLR